MIRSGILFIVALITLGGLVPARIDAAGRAAGEGAQAAHDTAAQPMIAQRANLAIFVRGIRIGSEQLAIERSADEWVVQGNGRLQSPIDLNLRRAEIRYNTDLTPKSARVDGWLRDHSLNLDATFTGTTVRNKYDESGEAKESDATVSQGIVVLTESFFGAYAVLGSRLAASAPGTEIPVYVAPRGETSVVLKEVVSERLQVATRTFNVRRHRLTFNPGSPFDVEIETEEDGRFVRLIIPSIDLQVAREDVISVAARKQRFFREGDEDVFVAANGFSLAGTISRPHTMPPPPPGKKTARLPAVVLVPGSGEVDRDHFIYGIPMIGQLAAGFADAGFLVVRYDKRGIGQSGGREEAATLADYADDVVAIARWLGKRKDVDPRMITLVGYGEGAWVSLLAASRENDIARVALVAAAGTKGTELVLEQQQMALRRMSLPEAEKNERVALQQKIHAALLSGGSWSGVPEDVRKQADSPWFSSLLSYDPAAVMAKVRQPILVVTAERDGQVPAHHSEKLMALARARKKDPGETAVTIPAVNHLLVPATTGEPDEYASLPDRTVSPAVASTIAGWIHGK